MSSIGFNTKEEMAERATIKEKVYDSLKDTFRPEFLNRIDEVVIFNYLKKPEIKRIVDLELSKMEKRLLLKEIKVDISDKAKEFLVKEGFDPNLGARPLKRVIQRLILDPLSMKIVTNEDAECKYSFNNCDFVFEEGLAMIYNPISIKNSHFVEWKSGAKYYIKCQDQYGNSPNPDKCSIIVSAIDLEKN